MEHIYLSYRRGVGCVFFKMKERKCKRLLKKDLQCNSTTTTTTTTAADAAADQDHDEELSRDMLRRLVAFKALMKQARTCIDKEKPVDDEVRRAVQAVSNAIEYFVRNVTKDPPGEGRPSRYGCQIPAQDCSGQTDRNRKQLLIIAQKLEQQLPCFRKVLPGVMALTGSSSSSSSSSGTSSGKVKSKKEKARGRKRALMKQRKANEGMRV